MTAQIIDGKALAEELRQSFKARVETLTAKGHKPGLVVILVGEDPASQVYVRNKVNACEQAGFHSVKCTFAPDVEPQVVLAKIAELNADPAIHGILVQLPLPRQFVAERLDKCAAKIAGIARVVVGKNADMHGVPLYHARSAGAGVQPIGAQASSPASPRL